MMTSIEMARSGQVSVQVDKAFRSLVDKVWLGRVARTVLTVEQAGPGVELSLTVSGDRVVHSLNRDYRGKDATTDVLSFALTAQKGRVKFVLPPDGLRHLGEVVVSYPQAARQARERSHSVERELAILVIHGILHLLGYDHEGPAADMRDKEQAILDSIAYPSMPSLTEDLK
ncbi:MAG: rRNA maturation RNase YbeY [Dehalococcoidia bacterium]|nr:rRNA maturation RNase YbeY [Dehalococcoidia bacterium]